MVTDQQDLTGSIDRLITSWKGAYSVIKSVDTPLNTASPAETIARLEKQLVETPHFLDLKTELARRYMANEQFSAAAGQLADILAAEPHNVTARQLLAEAFMAGKDYECAIRVASWIIEEDKSSTDARSILADAHMKLGHYEKAIDYLRALADENSLDVVVQNNLGVAHTHMKQFDLAARIFEKTIRIDKANAVGYYNLAICYAQQGLAQKACDQIYGASEQFGPAFVAQWINAKQFGPISDTAPFERLKMRFASYLTGVPEATVLMQKEERPTAPFGKATLPEFNLDTK